jgi:uncharacterized Zn-finger protein
MQESITWVERDQLNANGGLHCLGARADHPQWSGHPRVFLDLSEQAQAKCPYCGEIFRLKDAPLPGAH